MRPELSGALGHARFVREIQIAARLNHPHILPLFDSVEVADRLLFVMPYVAGESLRSRLEREGSLPIAEATEIARQVASALHYAHQQGVVHRDIKPENILLQSGQAVVTDFGIARAIDTTGGGAGRLTQTGMAIGTPRYMSPEQIAGDPTDGASDVYSLGCVLYEMLTGNPPFDGPTAHSLLARHALEQPSSPRTQRRDLTRELESIVLTALAKEPRQRFPTAGSMASALAGDTAVPARRACSRAC